MSDDGQRKAPPNVPDLASQVYWDPPDPDPVLDELKAAHREKRGEQNQASDDDA